MFDDARVATARAALARAEVATGVRSGHGTVDLPAGLGALLPGGLARGSVLGVRGSTSVLFAVMAAAMAREGWAASIGMPDLGWLAASEAGVDLARVVGIPRAGAAAADVVAACVDGFDVVVLGDGIDFGAGARRSLLGRIRSHGTVVLAAWPGSPVLHATVRGGEGCGSGTGHLRARVIAVRRDGSPTTVLLRMGQRPELLEATRRHLQAVS
ncbi:MAG: hypothetical protein EOL89_07270 [Actinobacteria bacterium]|nr:hypothetical protein [Actinomycetota bacterium]